MEDIQYSKVSKRDTSILPSNSILTGFVAEPQVALMEQAYNRRKAVHMAYARQDHKH